MSSAEMDEVRYQSYVILPSEAYTPLPPEFSGPEVRYQENLVRHFLERFTRAGDVVLDPFAGFGTTLRVAETLGRAAYGVEFGRRKAEYARTGLTHPERLLHGDSHRLLTYGLPSFDLSITSPPFMGRHDRENPLADYATPGLGYARYLADLRDIYAQVAVLMRPEARVVVEVANMKLADGLTLLAWDVAGALSEVLHFEGEIIAAWEGGYGYGYEHSYCLVFTKPARPG